MQQQQLTTDLSPIDQAYIAECIVAEQLRFDVLHQRSHAAATVGNILVHNSSQHVA